MSPPRAAILMYHRVAEVCADPEEGDYALPVTLFEAQLRLLVVERRPVVSLDALARGRYPDHSVVLTFDDGCDSDAAIVAPALRALGFPAVFCVNPARIGDEGRASWAQLRTLADQGFEVGSHGLDHTLLDALPPAELSRQLAESKRQIEERLSRPVTVLSLPGGSGGERARRAAHAAGYRLVLGSRPGLVGPGTKAGILPRLAVRRSHDLAGFSAAIDQQPMFLLWQTVRYRLGHSARSLLGASAYGRLRLAWLARNGRT